MEIANLTPTKINAKYELRGTATVKNGCSVELAQVQFLCHEDAQIRDAAYGLDD